MPSPSPGPVGYDPRQPPPRCGARLRYHATADGGATREQRTARCHLDEGHPGNHVATLPAPGGGHGNRHAFRA